MNWAVLIPSIAAILSSLATYLHSKGTRKQLSNHLDNLPK